MTTTTHRFYVYAFLRLDGTPYYIGKGTGGRINSSRGRTWKLPPEDRRKILVDGLTEPEAFGYEIALISLLGRKDLGTGCLRNRTDGGDGVSGHVHSAETRAKTSAALKGRNLSAEHRAKISAANKGRAYSPETRAKLSAAASNPSPETRARFSAANSNPSSERRAKVSAALRGRNLSPEHRTKISAAGRNRSPETRAKVSAALAAHHAAKRAQREALSGQLALLQEVG